jgi:hypothetical protein
MDALEPGASPHCPEVPFADRGLRDATAPRVPAPPCPAWPPGGAVLELICLACGHTNPSDARFCSQCGAALLRRFCDQCRAVNDAEAHFCHACGATLPEQLVPATSTSTADDVSANTRSRASSPPADFPILTEVMEADAAEPSMTGHPLPPLNGPAFGGLPDASLPETRTAATRATRRPVLLGVGALVVLLVVAALWARAPRTSPPSQKADTSSTQGAAPADLPAPSSATATPAAPAGAPTTSATTGSSEGIDGEAPPTREAAQPGEAKAGTEEALPAPYPAPRPAAPSRSTDEARRPAATPRPPPRTAAPARPPAQRPATECTPQLDALGLCTPGSTITGR